MLSKIKLIVQLVSFWADPIESTGYIAVQSVTDQATGLTVELGRLVNFSSDCFVVNVFEEQEAHRQAEDAASPIMLACGVGAARPRLSFFENGCYVFSVYYSFGGLRERDVVPPEKRTLIVLRVDPSRAEGRVAAIIGALVGSGPTNPLRGLVISRLQEAGHPDFANCRAVRSV